MDGLDPYDPLAVNTISWSPSGELLTAGDGSGSIQVWDERTGSLYRRITAHTSHVMAVVWHSEGQIVSGSYDGSIRVWIRRPVNVLRLCVTKNGLQLCHSRLTSQCRRPGRRECEDSPVSDATRRLSVLCTYSDYWAASIAFHPHAPVLAISGNSGVALWSFGYRNNL